MGYEEFSVSSPLDGKNYHCRFQTLMTGISLRHSDTVDVKFLVNGKGTVIALPHSALAEYRRQQGRGLTDADVIQIAGLFLMQLLKTGNWVDEPLVTGSAQQTLDLAQRIHASVSGQSVD